MKIVSTTENFDNIFKTFEEKVKALYECGYKCIDISFFNKERVREFITPDWQDKVKKLGEFAGGLGMEFVQSHTPFVPFGAPITQEDIELTYRSIEVAGMLGVKNTVIHPACPTVHPEKELEFVRNFFPVLEKYDINLLEENSGNNIPPEEKPDRYYTGAQLINLIKYINHPNVHACWDTGHANLVGEEKSLQREGILALGSHLKAIHFNDNNGFMDLHLLPFGGTLNVDEVMCALKDIGYDGNFTFECGIFKAPDVYYKEKRGGEKEGAMVFLPAEFKIKEQKMVYEIGIAILNHYGIEIE